MKPLKKAARSEKSIQDAIIRRAASLGWSFCQKFHGSQFQKGVPDLMLAGPGMPVVFVEVKKPKTGRLTKAQKVVFPKWVAAGVPLWILDHEDQVEDLLAGSPNCGKWLS